MRFATYPIKCGLIRNTGNKIIARKRNGRANVNSCRLLLNHLKTAEQQQVNKEMRSF